MELSEKNRDAITRLAKSSDAQKLMELLRQQNGQVQQAAQAAAAGDPGHPEVQGITGHCNGPFLVAQTG